MARLRPTRPSPAMVVALLALVVSMGGTGYAALKLPARSIGTRELQHGAVTSAKVRDHSLRKADFAAKQLPHEGRAAVWALLRGNGGDPRIVRGRGAVRVEHVDKGVFDVFFDRSLHNCSIAMGSFQDAVLLSGFTEDEIANVPPGAVRVYFYDTRYDTYSDGGTGFVNVFC